MAHRERLKILNKLEIDDLYTPPHYTIEQQRYFFTLDVIELEEALRDMPFGKNYRWQSLGLLIVTAAVVSNFL